jgi:hypothetical protein
MATPFVTVRTAAIIYPHSKRTVQNGHSGLTTLADARLRSRPCAQPAPVRNEIAAHQGASVWNRLGT